MKKAVIIGCGAIATMHIDGIKKMEDVTLAAVCDIKPDRAQKAAERGECKWYTDYKDMIEQEKPDVVHVCTPHFLHEPMSVYCLERNIHVLQEKPLAANLEQAQNLIETAKNSKACFGVCFQNRYNYATQVLKELLESGKLGTLRGIRAFVTWHRTPPYYTESGWRGKWDTEGGGSLINQSIHTLDLIQWFMDDLTEVYGNAQTTVLHDTIETEDTAHIVIQDKNGVRGILLSTVAFTKDAPVLIEFHTDNAVARIEGDLTVRYHDGKTEIYNEKQAYLSDQKNYWGSSHNRLIRDYYENLDTGKPFWIGAEEASKALRILMEVYRQSNLI